MCLKEEKRLVHDRGIIPDAGLAISVVTFKRGQHCHQVSYLVAADHSVMGGFLRGRQDKS